MKNLSETGYENALNFLSSQARPLELARWEYSSGTGDAESVLRELQVFVNSDGGFGKALESDMRSVKSSVLATVEALDIMDEIGLSHDTPVSVKAIEWLCSPDGGYDAEAGLWPYLGRDLDEAPHAPWWDIENLADTFGNFLINPRGRILAHLVRIGSTEYQDSLEALIHSVDKIGDVAPPDTLRSLVSLHEAVISRQITNKYAESLSGLIAKLIPASVVTDPNSWGEYGLQPLEVASSPDSPWLKSLHQPVEAHLDYLVETQDSDGSWKPFWTWGDRFPEAWKQAETEWRGVLTLKNLKRLRAFGRIFSKTG